MPLLVLVALASRLVNLDRYTGSYPEGVRAEQLLLMSQGFRPFRDIFSDQGPWLLDVLYPGFVLFGPSLVGVRAVVVFASLVCLVGVYLVGRRMGGPLAGLVGVALLVASPTYLKFSRLAVAELVAIAPAVLALGAALRYADGGRRRWLVAAGALYGVSLLIKPIAFAVGPALLLASASGGWRPGSWRATGLLALSSGLTVLVGALLVGLPEIAQQIVLFRLQSRAVEGWSMAANLARAREELADEGIAFYLLGLLGLGLALARRRTWPLALWALCSLATVAVHSPLHAKHFTLAVVPTALLAGLPLARLANLPRVAGSGRAGQAVALLTAVLGVLYLVGLPAILARDREALTSRDLFDRDPSVVWYDDATASLRQSTPAGSFVVTDHAYLAFAAGRPLPPFLAEASATRVRAGTLSDEQAIEHTSRFDSRAVLLWADKLVDLKRYRAWLQGEYRLAKVWATEADTRPELWLPRRDEPSAQRAALREGLSPGPSQALDGRLRAVALALHSPAVAPGEIVGVTVEWEAVQGVQADTLIELSLRRPGGEVIEDEREPLLGGRLTLEPGWWVVWVGGVHAPADLAPGRYDVVLRLRDRVNRRLGEEHPIGQVEIQPR